MCREVVLWKLVAWAISVAVMLAVFAFLFLVNGKKVSDWEISTSFTAL